MRARSSDFLGGRAALTRRQLLLLGALLPALQFCGRQASPARRLRVFLPLDAYERAIFEREILPPFARQHGVAVTLEPGTGAEVVERLRTSAGGATGSLALAAIDLETLGGLVTARAVAPLNAYRARLPRETPPACVQAIESAGTLYALPWRPAIWVSFYNREALAARQLAPPTTWDAFRDVATRLHDAGATGQAALQGAAGGPAAQSLVELVWAFGGDPLALDDPGSLAAANALAGLAPVLAPSSTSAKVDTLTTALGNGSVALGPNWAAVARDLLQRGGERAIATYSGPAGPVGGFRLISGQVLVVPASAGAEPLTAALLDYLWSAPVQRQLAARLAWLPLRPSAYDALPDWFRPTGFAARDALATARALPPLPNRDAVDAILGDTFRALAFAGVPARDALANGAARLRALPVTPS